MDVSTLPSTTIIILLLFTTSPGLASSAKHNNFTDLSALLAFKAHVRDPNGILARNWTSNTSFCQWIGVSCSRRRKRVTVLWLRDFSLHGTIRPHLANLSMLEHINLRNNALVGPIPQELGHLPRLFHLNLQWNQLSGSVPPSIFNMSWLTTLRLTSNNLTGALPASNHSLGLRVIRVSLNQLSGEIPRGFASSPHLWYMSLSENQFTGVIPEELATLAELRILYLGSNRLTGSLRPSLCNLTKLTQLSLPVNNLSGEIPAELGSLTSLMLLRLDTNQLTGTIPSTLSNLSMLRTLDLSENKLSGPVPPTIGKDMPLLTTMRIHRNKLTGGLGFISSLPNCRALKQLSFSENKLGGVLPESVGNLSAHLVLINGYNNYITGEIPAALGNLSGLISLNLARNELQGKIPRELKRMEVLQQLLLYSNELEDDIPHELGQLKNLFQLELWDNALSGAIPDSIGNITTLEILILSGNALSSMIPRSIWSLIDLTDLETSQNSLDGVLPPEVGNLKSLVAMDLSANHLSGTIPSTLGNLQMVTDLLLSQNSFHGPIPQEIGRLLTVQSLDLSSNSLSGAIPESLASLQYLTALNLSFNKLEGEIPHGGAFSNISIQSLMGNAALCGGAPRQGFPPCPTDTASHSNKKKKGRSVLKYAVPAAAFATVLVACLCILLLLRRRRTKTQMPGDTPQLHEHRLISYHELVRATENFSEANLLGRGSFGSVFKGRLDDGTYAGIKVLNLEIEGASRSFDAECQALRMLRHRNLVRIISSCSNLDFKALVLQFMPNGSLERWLYSYNNCLSLLQRISIMLDVALALEHLHHHHSQVVLHCDLKPSNVLLDEDMNARVADFGIAKLLLGNSRTLVTTNTPGTIGYMAPEYGSTGRVSRRVDVYSYGILLLETLTRKKPTDPMFDEGRSLRHWVSEAHPIAVLDVVDANLLGYDVNTDSRGAEYGDTRPNEDQSARDHCLSSLIELGLLCSRDSPKERILMKEVVPRLKKIKMEYLSKLHANA